MHTFGFIVFTVGMTLPITAIPIQDIIKNPECFYEAPLQILHMPSITAAAFILNCSHWMNISWIKKWRHFVVISAVGLSGELICYSSGYAIWTFVLDLRYPIPFACYLYWYAIIMSQFITLYCLFPTDWRRVDAFGVRLRNMMAAIFWQVNGFTSVHAMLAALLLAFKHEYQWVIAIFLPLAREVSLWIMLKFARKASSGDLISTEITCGFTFSIWHALFHSYIVGSATTTESTMIVLAEESIIGIYMVVEIIWIHLKRPEHIQQQVRLLQKLVLKEFVGFIVPLTFLFCFTIAFYGPNSDKIGNVRNSYFGYQAVDDFTSHASRIASLFFIDVASAALGSALLWKFCNINVYRGLLALQQEFGDVILINLMHSLIAVRER